MIKLRGQIVDFKKKVFKIQRFFVKIAVPWYLDTDLGGQHPNGFRKLNPLLFHDETDDIAANTAAKAMKNLLVRINHKRRRFLVMKRTIRLKIPPCLF